MMTPVTFSAAFKTTSVKRQEEKFQQERRDANSPDKATQFGPVMKDQAGDVFLVCTEDDAIRLSRASTAYNLQHMKVATMGSRGRLPATEFTKANDYQKSYRAIQQEMLAKAESLD